MRELMGYPKTRKEAVAQDSTYYFTGKMCKNGHVSARFTSNKNCVMCVNARNRKRTRSGYWKDFGDQEYKEKKRKYAKEYVKKNKLSCEERGRRRRDIERRATCCTVEGKRKMRATYLRASLMAVETGVPYQVDHIIPLLHPMVCGLHVPANLQIITEAENRAKANYFNPDDW